MSESEKPNTDEQGKQNESTRGAPSFAKRMKPKNLEKLRDYGKDMIPPGVA